MRIISPILVICIIGILMSCNETQDSLPFELQKLVGRWEEKADSSDHIEVWTRESENTIWGRGFVLDRNDTTFIEYLAIQPVNDTLSYLARVSSRFTGEIVRFPVKSQSSKKIVFENLNHDFPQRIVYELKNDSVLDVFVEGPENGVVRRIDFNFVKK